MWRDFDPAQVLVAINLFASRLASHLVFFQIRTNRHTASLSFRGLAHLHQLVVLDTLTQFVDGPHSADAPSVPSSLLT